MQEALEMVCRKRRFNPKDYALLLGDMSILIPLDRTVASLQGKRDLVLIKKSMLQQIGPDALKATGKTTDPNGKTKIPCPSIMMTLISFPASIFKRMSDTPEVKMSSALDYTAAYKVLYFVNGETSRYPSDMRSLEIHHLPQDAHACGKTRTHSCYRWRLYSCSFRFYKI